MTPGFHMNSTSYNTHLNTVGNQVHPLSATASLDGSAPKAGQCAFTHCKTVQDWPKERDWAGLVSKLPRYHSDQAFRGCAWPERIHGSLTLDWTLPWIIRALTQDLRGCPVLSGTRAIAAGNFIPASPKWGLHGWDLLQHIPWMLNWNGI